MPCTVLNAGQTIDWSDLSSSYTLLPCSPSVPESTDHHLTWPDRDTHANTKGFGKHLMRSSRPVYLMLNTALRSGASLRRSSLKQKKLSRVLWNVNIRIGSMTMMSVSLSYYIQRIRPMWSGKMTQAPNPRQTNSDISEEKLRRDCVWWKTIHGKERQMKCKGMQTQTTPNNSSEIWRLYMDLQKLESPICYQLLDQHWARTKRLWENDGQNILATYWTDLHQSVPLHLTTSLSSPTGMSFIICHQSLKSRKPFTRWAPIEHQHKMASQPSCTKLQVQKQLMSSTIFSVASGDNRGFQKISEMPWLWPSTK